MPSAVFTVEGIAPEREWAWHLAGEGVHRQFWRAVVTYVIDAKDISLAKGLDRHGSPLRPISERTRRNRKSAMGKADKFAPPLTPAHGLSRTRAWLTGRAYPDRAMFYWKGGWGKILDMHRRGAGHLPVRDVIGLSYKDLVKVEQRANAWWRAWKQGSQVESQAREFKFVAPAAVKVQPAPGKVAVVVPPPRKIAVRGRTDFENATFGIGGPGSGIERARAALAEGYSSGMYQKRGPQRPKQPPPALAPRNNPNRPNLKRAAARTGK